MKKIGKVRNVSGKKVHIITKDKEFAIVRRNSTTPIVGEMYEGEEYTNKIRIFPIIAVILFFVCIYGIFTYTSNNLSNLQVIVKMNAQFKIHINNSNEIVKVEPLNSKGKNIAKFASFDDLSLNEGLEKLFSICKAKDFITDDFYNHQTKIRIWVSNNYDKIPIDFSPFEEYMKDYKILVEINNYGEGNI